MKNHSGKSSVFSFHVGFTLKTLYGAVGMDVRQRWERYQSLPAGGFFLFEAQSVVLSCCFGLFLLTQRREALRCSVPSNSSPSLSCKSTFPARPGATGLLRAHALTCSLLALHLSQPWFHGGVSRKEAQRLIEKQGLVDGSVFCLDAKPASRIHGDDACVCVAACS